MRALIIYGSSRGNTRLVVNRLSERLDFHIDLAEASTLLDANTISEYDLLLFFASTWGDGELQIDMENFFIRNLINLNGKPYAICELGNYYGYDDFTFGASYIMKKLLEKWNGYELIEPFSMDSFPYKDWDSLARWCDLLNKNVEKLK
jgi:flavodoxin